MTMVVEAAERRWARGVATWFASAGRCERSRRDLTQHPDTLGGERRARRRPSGYKARKGGTSGISGLGVAAAGE